jgi:hypothetical protein
MVNGHPLFHVAKIISFPEMLYIIFGWFMEMALGASSGSIGPKIIYFLEMLYAFFDWFMEMTLKHLPTPWAENYIFSGDSLHTPLIVCGNSLRSVGEGFYMPLSVESSTASAGENITTPLMTRIY